MLRIFSPVSIQRRPRRLLAIHRSSSGNYEYASRPGLPRRNRSKRFAAHIFPVAIVGRSSILALPLPLNLNLLLALGRRKQRKRWRKIISATLDTDGALVLRRMTAAE